MGEETTSNSQPLLGLVVGGGLPTDLLTIKFIKMGLLAKVQVLVPSTTAVSNVTSHGLFESHCSNETDTFKLTQPKEGAKHGSVLIISKTEKDAQGRPLIKKMNLSIELTMLHKAGLFDEKQLGKMFIYESLSKDKTPVFTVSHKIGGGGVEFGCEELVFKAKDLADLMNEAVL